MEGGAHYPFSSGTGGIFGYDSGMDYASDSNSNSNEQIDIVRENVNERDRL